MTALQSASGQNVEPSEWPFAAPTLVVQAVPAQDVTMESTAGTTSPDPALQTAVAESELGDILVRAQQFADETTENARRDAQIIVDSARTEARLIIAGAEQSAPTVVESARVEARRIVEEAGQQAARQAREIVDAARADAKRIVEDARAHALQLAPEITESARTDAQRTIDQAKQQATAHARSIVESARAEAQRIVDEATRLASSLAPGLSSNVSADTVANLTASIKEFADTNYALVEEMVRLRDSLAGSSAPLQPVQLQVASDSGDHSAPGASVAVPHIGQSANSQLWADLQALGRPIDGAS